MTAYPQSDFDIMRDSLNNQNLSLQYIRKNQQDAITEDMGIYDYGAAAVTGLWHGVSLSLPEQYMRVMHRLGTWFGSDSTTSWARGKLDEYAALRSENPDYQPDAKWMNSYYGRSIYNGFNSLATSAGLMLPGLALMPLTGGLGGGLLGSALLGTATSAGTLAGVAEFDNFIDEAYNQLSQINPRLTREEIEDEHFWNAAYSGLAEGGLEFASDVIGGKLIGMFGKAGAEPARHILSKLMRNTMRGMVSEIPLEMATASIQDWIRENAGLDHQGRIKAMIEALGPAVISGGAFGAIGTAGKALAERVEQPQQQQTAMSPKDSVDALERAVQEHIQAELQDSLGDHGYQFYNDRLLQNPRMSEEHAKAFAALASSQANRWARESGQDKGKWWDNKNQQIDVLSDAGWSDTLAVSQALVTPNASFDKILDSGMNSLVSVLNIQQQEGLGQQYKLVDETTGEVGIDKESLQNDFASWIKHPRSVELSENTKAAFTSMRDNLLDSYNAIKQTGSVKISTEAQQLFEKAFERLGKREYKQPAMFEPQDTDALQQELITVNLNSSDSNAKIAKAFAKHSRFNFNPWTVGEDLKATFAKFDEALGPQLDTLLKRQSDAEQDAKVMAEMKSKGYTEDGIQSLFNDTVDHGEGTLSYRLRKALIYQTVSTENIQMLAAEYNLNPSPETAVQMRMATLVHAGLHAQMRGIRSEMGRALRAFRNAGKETTLDKQAINNLYENMGGEGYYNKLATLIGNAKNSDAVNDIIEKSAYAKTEAMLIEHVTLGMLTNPATQIVNVAGNGLTLVQETFNRLVGEKLSTDGGIARGETMAMVNGFFQAWKNIKEVWGNHKEKQGGTWNALKNIEAMQWGNNGNTILDDAGTMDRQLTRENAQSVLDSASQGLGVTRVANAMGLSSAHAKATHGLSTAVEYYGRTLGIVSKTLLTTDQFFKTVAYHMELNARLHRKAKQMSSDDASFADNYAKLSKRPLKADKEAAMEFAKRVTFQQDLGAIGRNLNKIRRDAPLTRLAIPFLKTPINILKYGAAHTPLLSRMVTEVRAELNSKDPAVRQLAEARVMTGTMLWTGAIGLAAQGMITGNGPADLEERRKLEATGWKPNSLVIAGKYYGIDRLDPGAFIFNTAASFMEIVQGLSDEDDFVKAFTAGLGASIRTITNRSYLQSVDNVMNAIMNLESTQGQRALNDIISNIVIPASAVTRNTAYMVDPVARETQGLFDRLRSTIPGLSLTAPERRNFLGEVVKGPEMLGSRFLSPIRYSENNNDPVYGEIARLSQSGFKVPGMPQRNIQHQNKRIKLDGEQYSRFLAYSGTEHKINGKTLKERLGQIVGSGAYQRATDEQKSNIIEDTVRTYRTAAKKMMIRNDSGIRYLLGLK